MKKTYLLVATCAVIMFFLAISVYKKSFLHQKSFPSLPIATPMQPSNTPVPSATNIPTPTLIKRDRVLLDVPFTVQAPFAEWKDPRQQDACEEAAVLMAMHWVKGQPIESRQQAKDEILAISTHEEETYNNFHDTSAIDTGKRIIEGYYHYTNYHVKAVTAAEDIIHELDKGNLVIVPSNGQKLGNPNFTAPGPERHMVVVKGYDRNTLEFITNDPGISQGQGWKYNQDVFFAAIRDYKTGDHLPITEEQKNMIIIEK